MSIRGSKQEAASATMAAPVAATTEVEAGATATPAAKAATAAASIATAAVAAQQQQQLLQRQSTATETMTITHHRAMLIHTIANLMPLKVATTESAATMEYLKINGGSATNGC